MFGPSLDSRHCYEDVLPWLERFREDVQELVNGCGSWLGAANAFLDDLTRFRQGLAEKPPEPRSDFGTLTQTLQLLCDNDYSVIDAAPLTEF
jgi:hypothetical protein